MRMNLSLQRTREQKQAFVSQPDAPAPRIALIGCGAIAAQGHLPALKRLGLRPTLLVDTDQGRLDAMSSLCGNPVTTTQLDAAWERFDAAIVAAPPSAHATLCEALLAAGKHVLVEKPLAIDAPAARRIVKAQKDSGGSVFVAHMRRFLAVNQWVRDLVISGELGAIVSVTAEEGTVYCWEGATAGHFRPETAGGGVLVDIGVHTLDILSWWLGSLELKRYADDNLGGVEANATMTLSSDCCRNIALDLSRTRTLRNSVRIHAEKVDLEVDLHTNHVATQARLPRRSQLPRVTQTFEDLFAAQLAAWLRALRGERTALVETADAAAVMELVGACYAEREEIVWPWARKGRQEVARV